MYPRVAHGKYRGGEFTPSTFDAVVVGSGVNGLVAAAELAKAGWSVALVERNDRLGGFIATEERTIPGYLHDTYSSWHPLFVCGAAYAVLGHDLHHHGLQYRNTDGPVTGTVADDGRVVLAYRDPKATAAEFAHPEDRTAYLAMLQRFLDNAAAIGGFLGSELRSPRVVRHAVRLLRRERLAGTEAWLRDTVTSGRSYCRREFCGDGPDLLWVPWLLHAGLSPDHASGGLMLPILAATIHGFGLPVVAGGSGCFVEAFRALFEELRVDIRTGCPVERILVTDGRATGVIAGGGAIHAARAVLASVTPSALYRQLLPATASISTAVRPQADRFRHGRAAMQIHVALSAPLGWNDDRLADVPLLHLSDGSASTGIACAEAEAGLLPRRPTVVVGQQHVLDPSRVPEGSSTCCWPTTTVGRRGNSPASASAQAIPVLADPSDRWSKGTAAKRSSFQPSGAERATWICIAARPWRKRSACVRTALLTEAVEGSNCL